MLLGLGITFQVGLQAVLNICVVTNTIPNTGISLPFFSYGGTALLMLLGQMGIFAEHLPQRECGEDLRPSRWGRSPGFAGMGSSGCRFPAGRRRRYARKEVGLE